MNGLSASRSKDVSINTSHQGSRSTRDPQGAIGVHGPKWKGVGGAWTRFEIDILSRIHKCTRSQSSSSVQHHPRIRITSPRILTNITTRKSVTMKTPASYLE